MLADTYRRRLRDRALDQYGYVTTRDAEELEVPVVEVRKVAHRGGVEHVAYGLYRFDDIPRTARDQFMEAVLRVGPDHLEPRDLTVYEGIPSATVARALLDCRGLVMGDRLLEAAHQAARVGLLRRREAGRVLAELGSAP